MGELYRSVSTRPWVPSICALGTFNLCSGYLQSVLWVPSTWTTGTWTTGTWTTGTFILDRGSFSLDQWYLYSGPWFLQSGPVVPLFWTVVPSVWTSGTFMLDRGSFSLEWYLYSGPWFLQSGPVVPLFWTVVPSGKLVAGWLSWLMSLLLQHSIGPTNCYLMRTALTGV